MKVDVLRLVIVAFAVVVASCSSKDGAGSGETSTASTATTPAASSGEASEITLPTVTYDAAKETDGPGLRRQALESLTLPVPRTIDLSYVQGEHFAVGLGKDPSRIFEYVRDQIAYEPYVGLLRGPRGTLLAMAGNSVDRAALLGELLQRSGFQVRYAHGTLPDALAQRLVDSVWAERRWVDAAASAAGTPDAKLKALGDRLVGSVQRDYTLVQDMLKDANLPARAESPVTMQELLSEARDHYWVEWLRDGTWTAMDPSFATAVPGQTFAEAVETVETFPESMYHRIEIKVRVEEYTGEQPSSREVLQYTAKSADLSGEDLILVHSPVDRRNQGNARVQPAFIVKQKRHEGEPFWVSEGRLPPGGGLADALGGGDGTVEVPIAASESIELDFIAPGGQKTTETRELFDHVGKSRRAADKVLDPAELAEAAASNADKFVSTIYGLFVSTGAIDAVHARNLVAPEPTTDTAHFDAGACLRRMNIGFAASSDLLTSRVGMADGMVSRNYFDSPRLQIAELAAAAGKLAIGLDLRRDSARTLVTGLQPDLAFNVQVWRGVVDGTLERYLIEFMSSSADGKGTGGSMVSTSSLFESARAKNTSAVLFVQNGTMPGSALTADTRARIEESIMAGHVLVAPQQPAVIGGAKRYAWWQVNPRSGQTIAVADDGRRAAGETVTVTMITTGSGGTALYVSVGGYGGWFFLAPGASAATFIAVIRSLAGVGTVLVQRGSRF
jgi:large repetitive protein